MKLPAAIAFALALLGAVPASAQEQDPVSGGVQGHLLVSGEGELGGALSADIWHGVDVFRIGGFIGAGAVPVTDSDERNRVFMPFGVSLAIEALGDTVGTSVRIRGGLWGGATQEAKLTVGGFLAASAYLLFRLGEGVGLGVGLEVWAVLGDGETLLFSPSAGLTWRPAS